MAGVEDVTWAAKEEQGQTETDELKYLKGGGVPEDEPHSPSE
jgi:hypothetical protein